MALPLPLPADNLVYELPDDKASAIARIESEFSKQGIAVLQDGPNFVVLFPEKQRKSLTNGLTFRGPELAASKPRDTTSPGSISLFNVEAQSVLTLYAELSHRTMLRPFILPPIAVRLKTACPLTKEEVAYATKTVLALNGIAVVDDGEKFAQALPAVQRGSVAARAPKPEPGSKLLDPAGVPSLGNSSPSRPQSQMERDFERWRKAFYDFIHYKRPQERPAQRLLELYASLAVKTAVVSTNYDRIPIWFHIETPLTKSELMYAIETTLDLSHLKILEGENNEIRLSSASGWSPPAAVGVPLPRSPAPGSDWPTIVLTPQDVDKNSVRLTTQRTDRQQNLSFRCVGKTSAEIENIRRSHPRVQVVRDGKVVVEIEQGAGGLRENVNGRSEYVGLVLILDDYDQAKLAEKALRGE
jgi:hypothetical protein